MVPVAVKEMVTVPVRYRLLVLPGKNVRLDRSLCVEVLGLT